MEDQKNVYETGVTQPGKSYRGLVAVLLMAVIFLSGVVTALGLMNVRLFRQLQAGDEQVAPVSLEGANPYGRMDVGTMAPQLGIWYVFVSGVCSEYYDIPQGVMVTSADEAATSAGILAGDILLEVDGQSAQTEQDLQQVLQGCEGAQQIQLTLYRVSEKRQLQLVLHLVK